MPSMGIQALTRLRTFEHELAIDGEIADDREFGHGLDADGLFELIDQRGAGHAGFAVDEHGAGAADFFEAIRIVGDRSGCLAVASDGIFADVAQADDHVHVGAPVEAEFFPVRGFFGRGLALDADDDFFFVVFLMETCQLEL